MSSRDRLYLALRALAVSASVTSTVDAAVAQNTVQFPCDRIRLVFNEDELRDIIRNDNTCAPFALQRLLLLTRGEEDSQSQEHPPLVSGY
jgi:hypothetical protein